MSYLINSLPVPVYVIMLIVSVILIGICIPREKYLSKTERIGYLGLVPMGVSLAVIKLHEETSFYTEYYKFFIGVIIVAFIMFFMAMIAGYKRIDDVEKKRAILKVVMLGGVFIILGVLAILYGLYLKGLI